MPVPKYLTDLRAKVGHDLLLLPAVCGLVFNDAGELLLGRRSDNGKWALLGGIMDPGEDPADACVREIHEETAVTVRPERITGIYVTPIINYPSGDQAQYVITTFFCRPIAGTPRVNDDESLEIRYFKTTALPDLAPHHLLRIEHALANQPAWFAPSSTNH